MRTFLNLIKSPSQPTNRPPAHHHPYFVSILSQKKTYIHAYTTRIHTPNKPHIDIAKALCSIHNLKIFSGILVHHFYPCVKAENIFLTFFLLTAKKWHNVTHSTVHSAFIRFIRLRNSDKTNRLLLLFRWFRLRLMSWATVLLNVRVCDICLDYVNTKYKMKKKKTTQSNYE